MGEKKLDEIVTAEELIASKRFDSMSDIYQVPASVLPRVKRGGKVVKPLRFYWSDVERLFSKPLEKMPEVKTVHIEERSSKIPKPSIQFKKRKK